MLNLNLLAIIVPETFSTFIQEYIYVLYMVGYASFFSTNLVNSLLYE